MARFGIRDGDLTREATLSAGTASVIIVASATTVSSAALVVVRATGRKTVVTTAPVAIVVASATLANDTRRLTLTVKILATSVHR